LAGVFAFSYQVYHGLGVWGLNWPVFWAFDITNFVFWIGISHAGTLISAILRLANAGWRRPVTRCAEAITVFALSIGAIIPICHLGRPWLFFWLVPYPSERHIWPNFRSPLLWDFFAILTYLTGSIDQPLTQQYKIGLGIRATELGRDIIREEVRAERQKIAAEVRTAYFNLFAIQANVDAAREAVKTFEETQRITVQYVSEKTVLRGDALEVDARLAKSRYELSVAENGLATQREALNQLLGRDVATPFRAEFVPEQDTSDLTLDSARQEALTNRPECRQSHLKEKQAEYDRRLAKAEYIPDLSLSLRYQGINNVQVLPRNVTTAGFYLTWEPFDWGRRHNKVVEATKTVEQAHNGIQETESKVAVEVGAKYRKWREASLLLNASRTAHEAAAEQLRVKGNKYKQQTALLRDLLQAQAQSSETNFQYQQALSSYWSAFAELRKAMGEE